MSGARQDSSCKGRETESRKSRIDRVMNRPHVPDRSHEMAIVVLKITLNVDEPVVM